MKIKLALAMLLFCVSAYAQTQTNTNLFFKRGFLVTTNNGSSILFEIRNIDGKSTSPMYRATNTVLITTNEPIVVHTNAEWRIYFKK